MFETEIRLYSVVRRWATIRSIQGQTLAEHSFNVAMYADQVADLIGWDGDRAALLRRAMSHDADELVTGDIPGTFKRHLSEETRGEVHDAAWERIGEWFGGPPVEDDPAVVAIVRVADALDDCLYAAIERRLGNRDFDVVATTAWNKLSRAIYALPCDAGRATTLRHAVEQAIGRHTHESARYVRG